MTTTTTRPLAVKDAPRQAPKAPAKPRTRKATTTKATPAKQSGRKSTTAKKAAPAKAPRARQSDTICSASGCDRPAKTKGLCRRHYNLAWRHSSATWAAYAEKAKADRAAATAERQAAKKAAADKPTATRPARTRKAGS